MLDSPVTVVDGRTGRVLCAPVRSPWAAEVSIPSFIILPVISEVHYLTDHLELWLSKGPVSHERKVSEHTYLQHDEYGSSIPAAVKQMSSLEQSQGPQCELGPELIRSN